jgi:lysophospholipase L1-like esterase
MQVVVCASVLAILAAFGAPGVSRSQGAQGVENPAALRGFFSQLAALKRGERTIPIHILQIGDSHSAGDQTTGALRTLFQAEYGAAGRGVLPPGKPFAGYAPRQATVTASTGWRLAASYLPDAWRPGPDIAPTTQEDGPFGVSGWRLTSTIAGADLTYTTTPDAPFSRVVICGLSHPASGSLSIVTGGRSVVWSLKGPNERPFCRTLDLPAPCTELQLVAGAHVTLTSVGLFDDRPGVVVSNLGLIGVRFSDLARRSDGLLRTELDTYAPNLIILAFGTNDGFDPHLDAPQLEALARDQIVRLKRLAPRAAVLVLGPPDGNTVRPDIPEDGVHNLNFACAPLTEDERLHYDERIAAQDPELARWYAPPNLRSATEALRRAAKAAGAGFWDWGGRMGGECSAHAWRQAEPPLMHGDHVHFTSAGGEAIARLLFDDLTAAAESEAP